MSMPIFHVILVFITFAGFQAFYIGSVVPPIIQEKNHDDNCSLETLNCLASGSEPIKYFLRTPNGSTKDTGRESSYKPDGPGTYQCFAQNDGGIDMSNILTVKTPLCSLLEQSQLSNPFLITKIVGDSVSLECRKDLINCTKYWKTNSREISQDSRTLITEDGTLIMLRLRDRDTAFYTCDIFDLRADKKVTLARYELNVLKRRTTPSPEALSLVYKSDDVVVREGHKVLLYCIFSQSDFSRTDLVTWMPPRPGIQIGSETFTIDNVQVSHSGKYTCKFKDLSYDIQLDVRAYPRCRETLLSRNITRGQNVHFVCSYPYDPALSSSSPPFFHLTWYLNGNVNTSYDNMNEISFENVLASFVITVNVSNGLQSRFYSAYVRVKYDVISIPATTTTSTTTTTTSSTTSTTTTTTTTTITPMTTTTSMKSVFVNHSLTTLEPFDKMINFQNSTESHQSKSSAKPTLPSFLPPFLQEYFPHITIGGVVGLVLLTISIVACCVCIRRKKKINKADQNMLLAVIAQDSADSVFPNPANVREDMPLQLEPAAINDLVNPPDEDSFSIRSSDSGFSDPTNEPLLKSNEQLNAENKSKSDSDQTIDGNNEQLLNVIIAGAH